MKIQLRTALLAGAGALAVTAANAQAPAGGEELTEVVVTGSRVITNGNDSPTPVTVVTVEDIQAVHPATPYEGLLDMPQFGGSKGVSASNPGGTGANNNNISAPNLRGLGQIRTLVLFDGHRMPPTEQDFLVDANLVPQMLLQRIDVVTGGASAVYGSDAMSGVVNFVTDHKFNGIKVQGRGGVSDYHDDRSAELGVAYGTELFGGRGHFIGSLEASRDAGIAHRTDRASFQPRWAVEGSCAPTPLTLNCPVPFYLAANSTISNYAFGGKIISVGGSTTAPAANLYFATNGNAVSFVNGQPIGVTGSVIQLGGSGAYNTGSSLKAKLGYQQAFGRFDFDLTDNTKVYLSVTGTNTHQFSFNGDTRTASPGVTLSTDNPYLPASVAALMPRASAFVFNKLWGGNNPDGASPVPTQNGDLFVNFRYANLGAEGSLGKYKWDFSYVNGDAKQHAVQNANIDYGRFLASINAVTDSSGQIVCSVTLTNPGLYPGCVPVNLFGPTSESQAAVNYFVRKTNIYTENKSDNVAASLTGAPFSSWAGPVNMALSGEWRKLSFNLSSETPPAFESPLDCTGLNRTGLTNCTAQTLTSAGVVNNAGTNKWLVGSTANRPTVSETISEAALESNLPLLADKTLAKAVDLNSAVRYARYSITGNPVVTQPSVTRKFNALTWKLGLSWHLNDVWTMRATRSRDFRAPNLNELFTPATVTANNGFNDIVCNCIPAGSVVQSSGNPTLSPEIAYTTTVGFVAQPTQDFSVALDGYEVRVKGFIPSGANGASGTNQAFQQVCLDSKGTSIYCTLIERSPTTGLATKFYSTFFNLGEQHTYGVDLETNYRTRLADHPLQLRGLVSYQPHVIYVLPFVDTVDAAGTINGAQAGPVGGVVRVSATARYAFNDHLSMDWLTRWRSGLHHNADPKQQVQAPYPVSPATAWSNVNLNYRFAPRSGWQADLYLNAQNVFNQLPPPTAFSGASAEPGLFGGLALGDDVAGRYYTLGFRVKL